MLNKQKDLQLQETRNQEATEAGMIAHAEYKSTANIEHQRSRVRFTKPIYSSLINRFRPPHTTGLTSVVEIPNVHEDVDNNGEVITNPYRISRNIEQFGQAQGIPNTTRKTTDELGHTLMLQQMFI